jgi:hypothetical protein
MGIIEKEKTGLSNPQLTAFNYIIETRSVIDGEVVQLNNQSLDRELAKYYAKDDNKTKRPWKNTEVSRRACKHCQGTGVLELSFKSHGVYTEATQICYCVERVLEKYYKDANVTEAIMS